MSAQTQPAPRPRVLVADDHGVVVEGVRGLLAKDYDVVGIVMDGRALIAEASRCDRMSLCSTWPCPC